jgi:hypothetical protein
MYLYDVKQLQNEYILHYLQSDIILYLFKTKNIFAVCLVTSMTIWTLFCWMHFYFYMPATDIVGIKYSYYGKQYLFVIYLICSDSDICTYRSEQRSRIFWKSQSRQPERGLRFGKRKVSVNLFCLLYLLCLIYYSVYRYLYPYVVCMYVCMYVHYYYC